MIPKTAATLTQADIVRFRDNLTRRPLSIAGQTQQRLVRARLIAGRAAALLKEKFSVPRVVVFGSITMPELFHTHSDIDLAAWGMNGSDYYRAVGVLQALDPEFSVDLVLFEEASPNLQRTIQSEGIDL